MNTESSQNEAASRPAVAWSGVLDGHARVLSCGNITLTLDSICDGEAFYRKHCGTPANPPTLADDWNRFCGLFRVPIEVWDRQVAV